MRTRTDYLLRLRPWSLTAFVVALLAVVVAASLQEVFTSFGTALHFASFFPAILVASLVAGAPAGTFAALLTIPVVWWAFMPPYFEFSALTAVDYDRFVIFVLLSSLVICVCQLYREARILLSNIMVPEKLTPDRPPYAKRLPE